MKSLNPLEGQVERAAKKLKEDEKQQRSVLYKDIATKKEEPTPIPHTTPPTPQPEPEPTYTYNRYTTTGSDTFVKQKQFITQRYDKPLSDIRDTKSNIQPNEYYTFERSIPGFWEIGNPPVQGQKYFNYLTQVEREIVQEKQATQEQEIKEGTYIKKDEEYYYAPDELLFVLRYGEPVESQKLYESIGQDEETYEAAYEAAYESLTSKEKTSYGGRFKPFIEEPIEEWKYYPGGTQHLESHKKESIEQFIESKGGYKDFFKNIYEDPLEIARKYASEGAIGDITKGVEKIKFTERYSWDILTKTPEERKEKYWTALPEPVKWYSSGFHATASATLWPVTLTQTGVKYSTGEGPLFTPLKGTPILVPNLIGRTKKGETIFFPDIGKELQKIKPGGPSGLISVGVSEGTKYIAGTKSDEWETFKKEPISGVFATGGELFGLYLGGKGLQSFKTGVVKGAGYIRTSIVSRTGWNLPTYTTFAKYSPVNIYRTAKWKYYQKTGRVTETPPGYGLNPESLPNRLSYAPGSTPSQRITSLYKAFEKSKEQTIYGEEFYTGIHTTTSSWYRPFKLLRKGRESPGVSFAPLGKGSPRFLRIGGESDLLSGGGLSIFPRIKLRTAPLLHFKEIKSIPKNLSKSYELANQFIKESGKGVYVAPKMYLGGAEYETIARGLVIRQGTRYFTRIEGITIPMPEFTLGVITFGSAFKSTVKDVFGVTSSYYAPSTVSILNPGYIVSQMKSKPVSTPVLKTISIPEMSSSISSKISSFSSNYSTISTSSSKTSKAISSVGISSPSIPSVPSYPSVSSPSVTSPPSIPSYPSVSPPSIPYSPSYPSPPTSTIPPPYKIYPLLPSGSEISKTGKQPGYNVYIKSRQYYKGKPQGKEQYRLLTKRSLSYDNAMNLMGSALDNSIAQSGYIKPSNKPAQKPTKQASSWGNLSYKFTKKGDKYMEDRLFAIDSPGEVQELNAFRWYQQQPRMQRPIRIISKNNSLSMKKMREMMRGMRI